MEKRGRVTKRRSCGIVLDDEERKPNFDQRGMQTTLYSLCEAISRRQTPPIELDRGVLRPKSVRSHEPFSFSVSRMSSLPTSPRVFIPFSSLLHFFQTNWTGGQERGAREKEVQLEMKDASHGVTEYQGQTRKHPLFLGVLFIPRRGNSGPRTDRRQGHQGVARKKDV